MVNSVAAPQARGKFAEDNIFGANNRECVGEGNRHRPCD